MSQTVAVVDYGMGNLRSVSQAVAHAAARADVKVIVTSNPEQVLLADRVVLPGQGAMRDCMRELRESGLEAAVREAARSKPLLGVCVGMQMLLDHSEEQDTPGLGLVPGRCLRFRLEGRRQPDGSRYKVPQMGWNRVAQKPHALDVVGLAGNISGAHVDQAFQAQHGRGRGCGHSVLARPGLGQKLGLAHVLGQDGLAERVVDFVRARVV